MNTSEFVEKLPLSSGCSVVGFDACGILAISKKAGRATHPNPNPSPNAKPPMLRARYNFDGEYYSWNDPSGEKMRLYLVNRLDSPTSGVLLAADNEKTAAAARAAFKNREVKKTYAAICVGKVLGRGEWIDRLRPFRRAGFVRTSADFAGRIAKTLYSFERSDANGLNISLVRLTPLTGLTHQLRVQCAMRGVPILGDATYGNFSFNKKFRSVSKINRLFLHCLHTGLELEIGGAKIEFEAEAPLPDSFCRVLDYNNEISKKIRP